MQSFAQTCSLVPARVILPKVTQAHFVLHGSSSSVHSTGYLVSSVLLICPTWLPPLRPNQSLLCNSYITHSTVLHVLWKNAHFLACPLCFVSVADYGLVADLFKVRYIFANWLWYYIVLYFQPYTKKNNTLVYKKVCYFLRKAFGSETLKTKLCIHSYRRSLKWRRRSEKKNLI